jgi:hypothetical protein
MLKHKRIDFSLYALLAILILLNGCSLHKGNITGRADAILTGSKINVEYDFHVRGDNIDSVAFQLIPEFRRTSIQYESEDRVKDSLYRSLGDSLDCCHSGWAGFLLELIRNSRSDTLNPKISIAPLCWWTSSVDTSTDKSPVYISRSGDPTKGSRYIDSVLKSVPLDSLRKISIPCSWKSAGTKYDKILQSDTILYRTNTVSKKGCPRLSGQFSYDASDNPPPQGYCLKVYGGNIEQSSIIYNPLPKIWEGIIPNRPQVSTFRFNEKGGFLGMAMGLGVSKFSRFGLSTSNSVIDYLKALSCGFSYYSPTAIYQFSGELRGMDRSGKKPRLGILSSLGIRHYPFTRNSSGLSWYGAIEFSEFKAREVEIDNSDFGFEFGLGYDTDFDRITYSYHTGQGGFHELEILVGLIAIQQGKAGLKASLLKSDIIRFATIQAYMENRVDFKTMELHNPRSLVTQALIYAGLITAWALIY